MTRPRGPRQVHVKGLPYFELSDTGVSWCETKTVTLTVRKDSNVWYDEDTKLEEVCGTATCDTNRLRKRTLFSLSAMEATVQM